MKCEYTPAQFIRATWEFRIIPYNEGTAGLYEDAPVDLDTRAIFQLVAPIREFLNRCEHNLVIDRGDFGEGDEFFYITLYGQEDADAFSRLCDSLRGA